MARFRLPTAWCFDARHELHAPRAGLPHKPADYLERCHEVPERATALYEALCAAGLVGGDGVLSLRVEQYNQVSLYQSPPAPNYQ